MGLNLYSQQVYIVKEARELLFDGYQDELIDMAREVARVSPVKLNIPYDRFGWFYGVCITFKCLKYQIPNIHTHSGSLFNREMVAMISVEVSTFTQERETLINWV